MNRIFLASLIFVSAVAWGSFFVPAGSITASQIANNTITASQIASGTITATQIASGTITSTQINSSAGITGSQLTSNVNLSGSTVQAGSLNVVTASTNATAGLKVIQGQIGGTGSIVSGEGFSVVHSGTGANTVTFSTAFSATPTVIAVIVGAGATQLFVYPTSISTTGFVMDTYNSTPTGANASTAFIAIGQR